MSVLFLALGSFVLYLVAYHTYGRWLGRRIFELSASRVCPSFHMADGVDYVPTARSVVFGHHFTSIAGTGPIVGPAIGVMWGWVPAMLWVVFGSIFIGFASLMLEAWLVVEAALMWKRTRSAPHLSPAQPRTGS